MKLSRRELTLAAATALASTVSAQTPTAPVGLSPEEQAKAAREANQRASETLAKFEIPMSTEPAFQFKP